MNKYKGPQGRLAGSEADWRVAHRQRIMSIKKKRLGGFATTPPMFGVYCDRGTKPHALLPSTMIIINLFRPMTRRAP